MDQILLKFMTEHLDTYSLFATILTAVLAVIIPILKNKCEKAIQKLDAIHEAIEVLLTECRTAYADKKITAEELKALIEQAIKVLEEIKKLKG